QAAFLRRYGVDPSLITPVNMTVDVSGIKRYLNEHTNAGLEFRKRFNLPTTSPVVLFLARLLPEKGLTDLLEAWEIVTRRLPKAHLVIVGDGELAPVVQAASSDRLHSLGRLSGEDVWQAYAAADVFVSPSHNEGWGLTVNEAMAADVPVIITESFGCIADLAVHNETACILPVARPDLLAEALERTIANQAWRERLRAGAREKIADWTIEAQAHRITQIWRACLSS
ncbi:MAG: glycosyltransferase family 4 protein, partial [Pseudomonadota bacterium]